MPLPKVTQVAGTAVHVPGSDIDTDRIIPARFLKCITFDGLGEFAFYDVRRKDDGSLKMYDGKPHPMDDSRFKGASILLSGTNFGCGSSREHAPQALYRFGFRAVIAESFAEIFFGNCTTLGVPCVEASQGDIAMLSRAIELNPKLEVTIDVEHKRVTYGEDDFAIRVADTAHESLTTGMWDPIAELLANKDKVAAMLASRPPLVASEVSREEMLLRDWQP